MCIQHLVCETNQNNHHLGDAFKINDDKVERDKRKYYVVLMGKYV